MKGNLKMVSKERWKKQRMRIFEEVGKNTRMMRMQQQEAIKKGQRTQQSRKRNFEREVSTEKKRKKSEIYKNDGGGRNKK